MFPPIASFHHCQVLNLNIRTPDKQFGRTSASINKRRFSDHSKVEHKPTTARTPPNKLLMTPFTPQILVAQWTNIAMAVKPVSANSHQTPNHNQAALKSFLLLAA